MRRKHSKIVFQIKRFKDDSHFLAINLRFGIIKIILARVLIEQFSNDQPRVHLHWRVSQVQIAMFILE